MFQRLRLVPALLAAGLTHSGAADLTVPLMVNPGLSQLTTTLCVQDQCSWDTQPIQGMLWITLPCSMPPGEARLRDLRLVAVTNHVAELDFGTDGKVSAILEDLVVYHAKPNAQSPPLPVQDGNVTFRKIRNLLTGSVAYHTEGLVCTLLKFVGMPCDDRLDLSQRPANTIDELVSQLLIYEGQVELTGSFRFKEPLSASGPELGRVEGSIGFTAIGRLIPSLQIDMDAETIRIRWCRFFEDFHVERADTLVGTWRRLDTVPESGSDEWSVRLPRDESGGFYRLRAD